MLNWKTLAVAICGFAAAASAHLKAGSLLPKGGETLKVGDVVTVSWTDDEIHHDRIDISLSKDNGTTWTDIRTGAPDEEKNGVFKWTVPASAVSTTAKIRVCQSGPCTPAQNTNRTTGNGGPWYMTSTTLTVQASTALNATAATQGLTVDFDPASRNVEVSFALAAAGNASLQAFDLEGRLVATLVDGRYEAGAHRFSVFANSLGSAQGLVLKLTVGGATRSHTWMTVR